MNTIIRVIFLICLMFFSPAVGQSIKAGAIAAAAGDYVKAREIWLPLAEAGDPKAQYFMGGSLECHCGSEPDFEKAIYWYQLSADQGFAHAQTSLANLYANGRGVTRDYPKALKLFRNAAQQGNSRAMNDLGGMFALGLGTKKDIVTAYVLFSLAKSNDARDAARNLAIAEAEMSVAQKKTAEAALKACLQADLKACF